MASSSEYFFTLFTTKLKEADQHDIELTDVNGVILTQLIDFCYTGTLYIDQANVQALLEAANHYRFTSVVTDCSEYLQEQLDATNCVGFFVFSELYDLKRLHNKSQMLICQHFMTVLESDEFGMMTIDTLKRILGMNALNINSEEIVFNAVMAWVNADEPNRKENFPMLLNYVRLTQLNEKVYLFELSSYLSDGL